MLEATIFKEQVQVYLAIGPGCADYTWATTACHTAFGADCDNPTYPAKLLVAPGADKYPSLGTFVPLEATGSP